MHTKLNILVEDAGPNHYKCINTRIIEKLRGWQKHPRIVWQKGNLHVWRLMQQNKQHFNFVSVKDYDVNDDTPTIYLVTIPFINDHLNTTWVNFLPDNTCKILKDKTIVNQLESIGFNDSDNGWWLSPGTYDVMCNEGCNIPANRTAMVRQRSSLLRNGAIIASSIFDPGFKTANIGTVMIVTERIFIEKDARIAQMYFHENKEGELYDGQFQNDKQRK